MNRNAVIFTLFVLCTSAAHAQEDPGPSIDSLRIVWGDVSRPDTARLKALQEVVFQRRYTAPPDSLLGLVREMITFAHDRGMKKQEATAWNFAGVFHNNLNQWDSAEVAYLNSLRMWEALGERGRMAGCYNNLGNVAAYKGDRPRAIEYLTNSLRIGEEIGDSSVIARALGNIGVCHYEQKEYDVALDYFHRRIAVADAIGDKQCSLEAYIAIGMLHDERKEPALAREGYVNCLRIAREIGDVTSIYVTLNALGTGYVAEGDYQRGLTYLDSSLTLASEHGDPSYESSALAGIAHAYHLQGKDARALTFAQRSLAKARISGVQEGVRDAAEVNYKVLKALGNEREALEMHELYIATRDSMANEENMKAVMSHRFEYEYEKKEALLHAEQEKKDAVAAEELRRKKVQRNAFIGGFGLMILLAGVFFTQRNRISKARKRSDELLLNILPEEVAEELKDTGAAQAKHFDTATIVFTDFKGFTQLSEKVTPTELVAELNTCFKEFDLLMAKYRIEKIKTIGDAYMAAGGLPDPQHGSAADVVRAALEMQDFMKRHKAEHEAVGKPYFEMRVGIHTGPVVAGIVGVKKFQYDIWGDTVNTASRMESSGEVGYVNISEATYALVKHETGLSFTARGKVQAKGKGEMEMYFVNLT